MQPSSPQPLKDAHLLAEALLQWYDRSARVLPWRVSGSRTHDPYTVWVSEIMLQQTTVLTVQRYFTPFIEHFPTVHHLAAASLDEVFSYWQGLGYYRRARLMHQCAQYLVSHHNGIFPSDYEALLALPGIGAYTAGAIRAIAFQKRALAIDGNVRRVLGRFLGHDVPVSDILLRSSLETITPTQRCGDFVQALMELGATVCMPRSALCTHCPWQSTCQTAHYGREITQPRIRQKKPQRYGAVYILYNAHGQIALERRPSEGLLAGLYGLPTSSWDDTPNAPWAPPYPCIQGSWHPRKVTHVFTHFKLTLSLFLGHVDLSHDLCSGLWVTPSHIPQYPLPTLFKKVLQTAHDQVSNSVGLRAMR